MKDVVVNVAAIIVTKGDQDITPVLASLPEEWDLLVWNNGLKALDRFDPGERVTRWRGVIEDLSVYGRYAAIRYTDADLIYVQDDDCVVSDPQAIVDAWTQTNWWDESGLEHTFSPVVCNMPSEFRHSFYEDHALVGFGACFHRDAPARAFARWPRAAEGLAINPMGVTDELFYRTCDIVFTALTPRVLVDVPYENLPWAHNDDRMWRQPSHQAERARMLDLVKQIS